MTERYHYTESGLDNIWLLDGYEWHQGPSGPKLKIRNIDGLHRAISRALVEKKGVITGKELRFLRHEMLLSQAQLAALLQITEQTVHRWEAGKSEIPKPAETLVRLLYSPVEGNLQPTLRKLAALDQDIGKFCFARPHRWHLCTTEIGIGSALARIGRSLGGANLPVPARRGNPKLPRLA
jgi:DNA-binding transcriptional regulator YiaG